VNELQVPNSGPPTQLDGPDGQFVCRRLELGDQQLQRLRSLAGSRSAFTRFSGTSRCRFHADVVVVFGGASEPLNLFLCFGCSQVQWRARGLSCHLEMTDAADHELRLVIGWPARP
jgi:hypothetical protein